MKSNDKKSKNNKKNKNKFNDYTSFLNPEIVASDRRECIPAFRLICTITANLKNLSKMPTICKKLIVCKCIVTGEQNSPATMHFSIKKKVVTKMLNSQTLFTKSDAPLYDRF